MYIREYMNIAQSMYQNISSLWTRGERGSFLDNKRLLELGNIIQTVDKNSVMNERIPQMVVVGTQSSGKSSVLNRILRMDILPVGKQMVTRTPLHMELNQSDTGDMARIEFGTYSGTANSWHKTHELTVNIPSKYADFVLINDKVEITFNNKKISGLIKRINKNIDELSQTVSIHIEFTNGAS